jgi:hypothetical protein
MWRVRCLSVRQRTLHVVRADFAEGDEPINLRFGECALSEKLTSPGNERGLGEASDAMAAAAVSVDQFGG